MQSLLLAVGSCVDDSLPEVVPCFDTVELAPSLNDQILLPGLRRPKGTGAHCEDGAALLGPCHRRIAGNRLALM